MADLSKLRFNGTDYNVKDASAPLRKFTNYSKTGNLPITSDDTTQTAIGKLEKALDDKINTSAKGTSNGVAELDANGKVPSSQLPSYVDDVLEYSAKSSFPATGETGKIYVDTTTNKTYRWSGSAYVEISESLALGETSSTAYRGDRGKAAYDHSQITNGNPHGTTGANTNLTGYSKGSSKDAVAATDTVNAAIAKHENRINANQTNILYSLQTGVKNLFNFDVWKDVGIARGTKTVGDNSITVTATSADAYTDYGASYPETVKIYVQHGDIVVLSWDYTPNNSQTDDKTYIFGFGSNPSTPVSNRNTNSQTEYLEYTVPENVQYVEIRFGVTTSGNSATYSNIMICTKAAWDQEPNVYRPFALPNYDLTVLEAEDRAALAECVDEGAKNLFDHEPVTTTGSDFVFADTPINPLPAGSYVFSYTSNQEETGDAQLVLKNGNTTLTEPIIISKSGRNVIPFTISSTANVILLYTIRAGTYSNFMLCTKTKYDISPNHEPYALPNTDLTRMMTPFFTVPINHNMIYRGQNLGDTLTADQDTALSSGNFTDLYLGDYWAKTVTVPAGTYTGGDGEEVTVPAQTNITLKAVIADFDTFFGGYASDSAIVNTHHAAVIVTGFSNVVWNKTASTAGGYAASLIHKWLVGSVLPQIETWFGSAKVLSHKKLLTNAITGDAASSWTWSSEKISLLSENQVYGSKIWGGSRAINGAYEPGEAFRHLTVFNHIATNLFFGSNNIWLRDIGTAAWPAFLDRSGSTGVYDASAEWIAPAAFILLS